MKDKVIIDLQTVNQRHFYQRVKRLLDIVLSFMGLIILAPVFLLVALAIKLDDGGPVFFSQERIGKNGRPFTIYKFRSMQADASQKQAQLVQYNELSGPMFKIKHDPRVTRVGKFIRKCSLDELPQLVNVLCGEMSLVGPRPPLKNEVDQYSPYDKQRLLVMPGCTGLWQVSERNQTGFAGMVRRDLEYIQKADIWLDIKIILKTIKIMLVPNSAY